MAAGRARKLVFHVEQWARAVVLREGEGIASSASSASGGRVASGGRLSPFFVPFCITVARGFMTQEHANWLVIVRPMHRVRAAEAQSQSKNDRYTKKT